MSAKPSNKREEPDAAAAPVAKKKKTSTAKEVWVRAPNQETMCDYNFECDDIAELYLKDGSLEIGSYGGSKTIDCDFKKVKESILETSKTKHGAYWTQEGDNPMMFEGTEKWKHMSKTPGVGVTFALRNSGCGDCFSPEEWEFTLEQLKSDPSTVRLKVKSTVICNCEDGCDEGDVGTFVAYPVDED